MLSELWIGGRRAYDSATSTQKRTEAPALTPASAMLVTPTPPFAELFREHAPHAGRALRNLGVGDADLQDALQETFLVVHKKLADFRGESSLRTWIYGICLRVAASHRRRPHVSREVANDEAMQGAAVTARSPQDEAEDRESLARLDAALDQLDDDKRAVFVLYELEEMTLAEIASAVGAPLPTVYSRLQAARKNIQNAFAEGPSAEEKGSGA